MKPVIVITMSITLSLPFLRARSLYQRGDRPSPVKATVHLDGPGRAIVIPGSTSTATGGGVIPIDWPGPGHFHQTYEHPNKIQAWARGQEGQVSEVSVTGRKVEAVLYGEKKNAIGEVQAIGTKKRLGQLNPLHKPSKVKAKSTTYTPAEAKSWIRGKGSAWARASNRGSGLHKSPPSSPTWSSTSGSTRSSGKSLSLGTSTSSEHSRGLFTALDEGDVSSSLP